jgi:hypothetical protein
MPLKRGIFFCISLIILKMDRNHLQESINLLPPVESPDQDRGTPTLRPYLRFVNLIVR